MAPPTAGGRPETRTPRPLIPSGRGACLPAVPPLFPTPTPGRGSLLTAVPCGRTGALLARDRGLSSLAAAGAAGGRRSRGALLPGLSAQDRKSTRLNSSHVRISYAVFCLK